MNYFTGFQPQNSTVPLKPVNNADSNSSISEIEVNITVLHSKLYQVMFFLQTTKHLVLRTTLGLAYTSTLKMLNPVVFLALSSL